MKLTIASKPVALPIDAKISIERKSPFTNEDTGSFSYPFPVPTAPNQQALGWPGKLQRVGDIADQSFILEDSGLQVMRGEVDYDDVTIKEIGVILKSGYTEFYKKMEGKKLEDIDYGSESWPASVENYTDPHSLAIYTKLLSWDEANTTDNEKYVLSPFLITPSSGTGFVYVNYQWSNNTNVTKLKCVTNVSNNNLAFGSFCLQFRFSFVLRKIFESAGYTIADDMFSPSEFNKAVFFGKIMSVQIKGFLSGGTAVLTPDMTSLQYSELMPAIQVIDFLDQVKKMFCMMYEIDELKKEVRIKLKKDVFLDENLDSLKMTELSGWTHSEQKALKGFTLRYASQDDELATYTEFPGLGTGVSVLPAPTIEDQILKLASAIGRGREYITIKNDDDTLEWKEVGRLREYKTGNGENEVEITAKVPFQTTYTIEGSSTIYECPSLMSIVRNANSSFTPLTSLVVTLYHGRKTFGPQSFPYSSFDQYSLDGTIDTGISLKPIYLYDHVYSEFLNWQTYRARAFTKYIELTLAQLVALQWGRRYNIDGIEVILDKINYELPHKGPVKIEGFTS